MGDIQKTSEWKLGRLRELILQIAEAGELSATGPKGVELWELLGAFKPQIKSESSGGVRCAQRILSVLGEFECDAELGHLGDHHDRESDVTWGQGSQRPRVRG